MASQEDEAVYDIAPSNSDSKGSNFSLLKQRFEQSNTMKLAMEKKPGDLRAASFSEKSAKAAVPGAPPKSKLPPGAVPLLPQKSVDKATVLVPQGSVDRTRKQSVPKDENIPPSATKQAKEFTPPSCPPPPLPEGNQKQKPFTAPKPHVLSRLDNNNEQVKPLTTEKTAVVNPIVQKCTSLVGELALLRAGTILEYAGKKYRSLPLPENGVPPKKPMLPPNVILPPLTGITIFDPSQLPNARVSEIPLFSEKEEESLAKKSAKEDDEEIYDDVGDTLKEMKSSSMQSPIGNLRISTEYTNRVSELIYEEFPD